MVYIEDIADAFEITMEDFQQYLNVETGEIVAIADSSITGVDEELEEIEDNNDYVLLPDQYELDEWYIMAGFAESLDDKEQRHILIDKLNRRKPFRNFKETINHLGILDDYYEYRRYEFCRKAVEWCLDQQIAYDVKSDKLKVLCEEYEQQYGSE